MLVFPIMLSLLSMAFNVGTAVKLIARPPASDEPLCLLAGRIAVTGLAGYFLFLLISQSAQAYKTLSAVMHEPAHLFPRLMPDEVSFRIRPTRT